ncbi:piggyBac transposable element-derived protein 4-like isoform X1, partial [Vespula squamosa]
DDEVVNFRKRVINRISSSSESDIEEAYTGNRHFCSFIGKNGLLMDLSSDISTCKVFSLFINEEMLSLLVTETNGYAEQKLYQNKVTNQARHKR